MRGELLRLCPGRDFKQPPLLGRVFHEFVHTQRIFDRGQIHVLEEFHLLEEPDRELRTVVTQDAVMQSIGCLRGKHECQDERGHGNSSNRGLARCAENRSK